ncbi:MAG: FAD binding domain-containing protein [Spirochaetota bacterium]
MVKKFKRDFDKMKYFSPDSLADAVEALLKYPDSHLLAGGTDLLVEKRSGKIRVETVVDLKRIEGLDKIETLPEGVQIGALVTVNRLLEKCPLLPGLEALKDAGKVFGCYEIRNRATIGGNIAHASPGAEYASTMVALNATFRIFGPSGVHEVPAEAFFTGPGRSILKRGEILIAMIVPLVPGSASAYVRASRVDGMDLAVINCALYVSNQDGGDGKGVRVCFGAVAEKPLRIIEIEKILSEGKWEGENLLKNVLKCKEILMKTLSPRETSIRANPFTKKVLAGNLLEDAIGRVGERLG